MTIGITEESLGAFYVAKKLTLIKRLVREHETRIKSELIEIKQNLDQELSEIISFIEELESLIDPEPEDVKLISGRLKYN